MSLPGHEAPEKKRLVPLTDYVGSFMAASFDANLASSKHNPHSSRLIDTLEFTEILRLIDEDKLIPIMDADDNPVSVFLPDKPDLRISDLAPHPALQDHGSPEGPGGKV